MRRSSSDLFLVGSRLVLPRILVRATGLGKSMVLLELLVTDIKHASVVGPLGEVIAGKFSAIASISSNLQPVYYI